jgi:hypothetical protein
VHERGNQGVHGIRCLRWFVMIRWAQGGTAGEVGAICRACIIQRVQGIVGVGYNITMGAILARRHRGARVPATTGAARRWLPVVGHGFVLVRIRMRYELADADAGGHEHLQNDQQDCHDSHGHAPSAQERNSWSHYRHMYAAGQSN